MYGGLVQHFSTPMTFLSKDLRSEKRIGPVIMNLLYINFIYWTHDKKPLFLTLKLNLLRCLDRRNGWTSCLLYDGPLFMFMFSNDIWCVSLVEWKGIFYLYFVYSYVDALPELWLLSFLSNHFYSKLAFFTRYFRRSYSTDVVFALLFLNTFFQWSHGIFVCVSYDIFR